jgi:hypothetical protein
MLKAINRRERAAKRTKTSKMSTLEKPIIPAFSVLRKNQNAYSPEELDRETTENFLLSYAVAEILRVLNLNEPGKPRKGVYLSSLCISIEFKGSINSEQIKHLEAASIGRWRYVLRPAVTPDRLEIIALCYPEYVRTAFELKQTKNG